MNLLRPSFLFVLPTALEGAGRLFDFGDTMSSYLEFASPGEADSAALRWDWRAVGSDFAEAMDEVAEELIAPDGPP